MNVTCKSCKTQYNVPITEQDFKCVCIDPFPMGGDLPPCDCAVMPGDIICVSSCSRQKVINRRVNAWIIRDNQRKIYACSQGV